MLASTIPNSRTCTFCVAVLACTACSKVNRQYEDFTGGNAGEGSGKTSSSAGAEANGGRGGGATGASAGSGGADSSRSTGGAINTSTYAGQGNIGGSSVSQAGAAVLGTGGIPVSTTAGGSGGVIAAGGAIAGAGTPAIGGTSASAGGAARGGAPATGGTLTTAGAAGTGGAGTGGAGTGGAGTGGAGTGGAGIGPSVVFTVATVVNGATTNITTATFGFGSSPAGATAYQCKVNSAPTFTDCTSGLSLSQLSAGGQSFTVHAVNAQGTIGPDSTRSWTIVPLATTIKNIRTAGTLDDYLVTVTTNVRATGFGTAAAQQVIFVQEAGPAANLVVDTTTDLTGSPVLNAGILTRALATQSVRAAGTPVTVTGTVAKNGLNLELARTSYIWGTGTAVPYIEPEVRTSTVFDSRLEGVRIALAGQIPSYNCSSGCYNSSVGNSALCIETTCMDSGCPATKIVTWMNIAGGTVTPITSGYGIWRGWLVKRNSYYEFWTDGSDSYGNDLCL